MKLKISRFSRLIAVILLLPAVVFFVYIAWPVDACRYAVLAARKLEPAAAGLRPETGSQILYVLGDWGMGNRAQRAVADLLKRDLAQLKNEPMPKYAPFVVGTGDNIYPAGLDEKPENQQRNIETLRQRFGTVYDSAVFAGKPLTFHFIPGNHDYRGNVFIEEAIAEGLYDGTDESLPIWKFYPVPHESVPDSNDAYELQALSLVSPDMRMLPEQIPAGDPELLTLAAIDTQFLLRLYEAKDSVTIKRQWDALAAIFTKNHGRWRMITGHHPVASHAEHGLPYSRLKRLTKYYDGFSTQHQENPVYQQFVADFKKFLKKYGIHFYLAGHDHTLQLLDIDGNTFQVVSGAGAEGAWVYSCQDTILAEDKLGLARFDLRPDELWLEYLMLDSESNTTRSIRYRFPRNLFDRPEPNIAIR